MGAVWNALEEYEKAIESFNTALSLRYAPDACHFGIGNACKNLRRYQ